jgi:hypothetical protein
MQTVDKLLCKYLEFKVVLFISTMFEALGPNVDGGRRVAHARVVFHLVVLFC